MKTWKVGHFYKKSGNTWNSQGILIHVLSMNSVGAVLTNFVSQRTITCHFFLPRYFATGSADALVSLWDLEELACVRTFSRLE